ERGTGLPYFGHELPDRFERSRSGAVSGWLPRKGVDEGARDLHQDAPIPRNRSEMTGRLDVAPRRDRTGHRVERHRVCFQFGECVVGGAVRQSFPPVPALGEQQTGETVDGSTLEGQIERRREEERSPIRLDGGLVASAEREARGVVPVRDHDAVTGVALRESEPSGEGG